MGVRGLPATGTPNERLNPKHLTDEDVKDLNGQDASIYRASLAHGTYLSIDRSDIPYRVKELARRMAKPRHVGYRQLLHFGRYIRGRMCVAWSDTDHAVCTEARKSTTGGASMFGGHVIKHWSSTQSLIALSSGEAEYYGCVRGNRLIIKTHTSVARSLASMRGLGGITRGEASVVTRKVQKVHNGEIKIEKVVGIRNRSDVIMKPKGGKSRMQNLEWTSQEATAKGRHDYCAKACQG